MCISKQIMWVISKSHHEKYLQFAKFLVSVEQFIQTVKGQNSFWQHNAFLTCSWKFLISNKLEQLKFKLEKWLGFWNMQEKLEKVFWLPWFLFESPTFLGSKLIFADSRFQICENAGAIKSDKIVNTPSKNILSHHGCLDFSLSCRLF